VAPKCIQKHHKNNFSTVASTVKVWKTRGRLVSLLCSAIQKTPPWPCDNVVFKRCRKELSSSNIIATVRVPTRVLCSGRNIGPVLKGPPSLFQDALNSIVYEFIR